MPNTRLRLWLVSVVLLSSAQVAQAHVETGQASGFVSGFSHPLFGLDHVVAMIAVGLWGSQLGIPALWLLPVTFPIVMAFGGMLGMLGVTLPGAEVGIAMSAVLLGAVVLMRMRPPLIAAALLVGCFAIFHGYAHGTELPAGQSGLLYSLGFVMATGCLHAIGIAIGLLHGWPWGRGLVQAAGGLVGVTGVVFLWRALA